MKILGIDPGMAIVGYGLIDYDGENITLLTSGSIRTDKTKTDAERLVEIYNDMTTIVEKYQPDFASIEKLFYFRNNTTIIPVAEARGVILTALEQHKIKFAEYTPMEIKQILTGYGKATKQDVKQHVQLILNQELPKLDDTIDAIGIAICHTRKMR
ncbi:crossover junction endodeoxyribonuclease RuvC [bacterium]|nr:crossover junction endodeoxyribonuclease RuvC [bacterium]